METPTAPESEPVISPSTAREIQQDYLEILGCTDWNKFDESNIFLIKQKIAFAIFGSPRSESGDLSSANSDSTYGYSTEELERVLPIYEKIYKFQKYSADHKSIFMSIIFVCCVPATTGVTNKNAYEKVKSDKINVSPVFRIRKCIKVTSPSDSRTGCCIFIDDIGRVYQSWSLYLENNQQPKGYIVAPADGRYHGRIVDDLVHVNLDVVLSPASSMSSQVRKVGDYVCTGVAIGAVGVVAVSMFAPIAAGVAVTTGVASGVTSIYGLFSSSRNLVDRNKHDQSVSLADPEARSCWLNLGASATGMVAGTSTRLLTKAASKGATIAIGFRLAHNSSIFMAALTSGAGLINTITNCVIKYNKTKQGPTSLEIFQIASSMLFLTNSIMSNKMAHTIIEETQNSQISTYRESLRSNRQRKIYDKMVAETRRINGKAKGNTEVIRGIQKIENKDQFFQDALRLNKQLNQHNVRIAMKDGQALLNGEHIINPQEFYNLNPMARATYLSSIGPADLSVSNVSTNLKVDIQPPSNFYKIALTATSTVGFLLKDFPDLSVASNDDILEYIALKICSFVNNTKIYEKLVEILKKLQNILTTRMLEELQALGVYGKDLFLKLFGIVYDYLKKICIDDSAIASFIDKLFVDGELDPKFIQNLLKYFQDILTKEYQNNVASEFESRCPICNGLTFSKD